MNNLLKITAYTARDQMRHKSFYILLGLSILFILMIRGCYDGEYIVNDKTSKQITLAKAEGNVYELAGVYDRKCFLVAENLLKKQVEQEKLSKKKEIVKVVRLVDKVGAQLIAAESLPFYSSNLFYNINQEKDFLSKQY